jgi:hypothetical protein
MQIKTMLGDRNVAQWQSTCLAWGPGFDPQHQKKQNKTTSTRMAIIKTKQVLVNMEKN